MAVALAILGTAFGLFLFLGKGQTGGPVIHDEFVYLLQARMLASGHLTMPPPPLPEFFEAPHVLLLPRYAAKYFPGHAALLAPFAAAGVPWLCGPLLLGLTCSSLFLAARLSALPRWAALAAPLALSGLGVCRATTGSWTRSPWALYAAQYMPFDSAVALALAALRDTGRRIADLGPAATAPYDRLRPAFAFVERARGLVFLRYPPGWDPRVDLTYNEPDLDRARAVRALDLGPRDAELMRAFPDRPAFLLDLGSGRLQRLR